MKKINIYFLLLSTLLVGITACSDDDDSAPSGNLPIADFSASDDDLSIEVGEVVTFTDASENAPYLFTWRVEGGNPTYSNQKSVEVEFISEGKQAVTLTVRNDAGADEITKYIEVTPLNIPDLAINATHKNAFRK